MVTGPNDRFADEQAALRRVATLAARASPPEEVFAAVAAELGRLLGADATLLSRYDPDDVATIIGEWTSTGSAGPAPVGSRLELGGGDLHTLVFRTCLPGRIDDYADATGPVADIARKAGVRSAVGVPISAEGRLWGIIVVASALGLAADTEARLAGFTKLVAAAIANAQARVELRGFAEEQAALRRVATLVARAARPEEVFAAVAEEVGRLLPADLTTVSRYDPGDVLTILGAWSSTGAVLPSSIGTQTSLGGQNMGTLVFRTRRPTRIDNYGDATGPASDVGREWGFRSAVGAPISIEGRLWGVMVVASIHEGPPLAADTEARLAGFTKLVAAAIANAQARVELRGFAEEQAALRRVATLVARAAPPEEVFAAVTAEAGRLLEVDSTVLSRYDPDDAVTIVGTWTSTGAAAPTPLGSRFELGGRNVATLVFETGGPAQLDDYVDVSVAIGDVGRGWGFRSAVGVPISVEGRLWGFMVVAYTHEGPPLPADTERRLAGFTELVASALANAQARVELRGFAEEQAALRRVATLVARAAPPEEVFAAVAEEVGRLLKVDFAHVSRYDPDGTATALGVWSSTDDGAGPVPGETQWSLGGRNVTTLVFETGRPARIDRYGEAFGAGADVGREWGFRSAVGVPISVERRLWGFILVAYMREEPLPADTEARLAGFTELVGTAIANAEAQAALAASRARIVAAADTTRNRIGRDLHDGAQQRLVSLALLVGAIQAAMPPAAGELTGPLDDVAAGLTDVLDELRELARGLHPAALAVGGLNPALKALARRSAVLVRLDIRVDGRLPDPIELAAYYVVAEALTNTAKHAHASVIDVQAETGEGVLHVRVRDDGRGGADPAGGSGLVGLTDRVEALGGRLSLHSPPGAGTTVEVVLPRTVPGRPRIPGANHRPPG
jgi:GAF domain-containing protein